jgi:transposase-like protein
MTKRSPFRYFKTSPEIIRLAVMMYVRFPLSLRNVEDLLHERGIDISHETVRFWWNRFGPMFAAEIRRKRVQKYGIVINQCVTAQRTFDARPAPSSDIIRAPRAAMSLRYPLHI